MRRRKAGVLVPLFSLRGSTSWGIGEFPDLVPFAAWLESAGQGFVQILPIHELPPGERSPYSALTAMALDPVYVALPRVEDFEALGGEAALDDAGRAELDELRRLPALDYGRIRPLKDRCLRMAFDRFMQREVAAGAPRARQFRQFCDQEMAWLDEYARFRALKAAHEERPWWEWPEPLAHRQPDALGAAYHDLEYEIDYRKYVQWVAARQWSAARIAARPVEVFGDLPFMISGDSPDVWARQEQFRFDATVGVPPDEFSDTGQDWGLPPWRWEAMQTDGFAWMRTRAARSAALFDGFRLDHLVGLYRTYIRPLDRTHEDFFAPAEEPAQTALGERLVGLYTDTGAEVVAEDLGTVPDFVRESLMRLGVPGFKVVRWERHWDEPGQPYRDPGEYPEISVATTGTHDVEPIAAWWQELPDEERRAVTELPAVARHMEAGLPATDALLRALLDSGSRLTILPVQDVFGWPDRINTPATVGEANWGFRLPWPVDSMAGRPEVQERARLLREWTEAAGRLPRRGT
ncbi:MAG: 4-alpha-glucanotransferase [Vicinamibacterales bacterium]